MAQPVARPELLVTPAWLHEHLQDSDLRVVDARTSEKHAAGHVPGAALVDTYALSTVDTSPEGVRAWIAGMEDAFTAAGVREGQTVVFYEDISGQLAARGVWALAYLGHDGGRLLDGGLNSWQAAGYEVRPGAADTARPAAEAAGPSGSAFRARPRPALVATYEDLLARLNDGRTQILDVRRPAEYAGAEIRAKRGGRVPGAVNLDWVHNLTPDGRFKSPADLEALYAPLGLDPTRETITYCQGGYRSAHTWLALRLIGYENARNYLGSWGEWGSRDGLPIENLTLPPSP